MKKLILLLSLIILSSCSSSSDDDSKNNNSKETYFNPPAWIIGTWKSNYGATLTFTKDNITSQIGGTSESLNDEANMLKKSGAKVSVVESKTDTNYTALYKFTENTTYTYSFSKLSDSQIESTGMFSGTFTKQ